MEAPADVITHRVPRAGLTRQIIVSLMVSLAPLNAGIIIGWLSPISLKLMADDSPVGVMTKEEISTLASIALYPLVVYAFILGYVSDRFGRKPALLMVGVPNIFSGAILTFATSKLWLYIGRTMSGLRSNGYFMSGMYISETVDGSIRGMMITFCSVQINIGLLLSYIAGKLLSYKVFNSLMIVIPCVFTVLMFWLPETPPYLLNKGKKHEAKAALIWLRGGSEAGARHELEAMKQPNAGEAFISTVSITTPSLVETFRTRGARRALAISISIFALQMFSGINIVTYYAGIIFKESGSPLSPEDSSIVTAIIILFGSLINLVIVDKFGRKPLLYASFGVGSISLAVLSIFLYVQMIGVDVTNYGWVSVASIGIYVFSFAIGLSALPGVIMNEVCSPIIKPTVLSLNAISTVICASLVLQLFPYLEKYWGLYSNFVIPSVINAFGVLFTWLVVPETKVSLAPLNAGIIIGWISPISLILLANNSPVGVMTIEEISTLASIGLYPLVAYAFIQGYVSDRFGRKPALLMDGIPNIFGGAIVTFATSKLWLYTGRTMSGLRSNGYFMSAMYLSETVDGSIRGMMITFCSVQINIGILISYLAGKLLSYKVFNSLMIIIPCVYTVLMFWLPETPPYLMNKGRKQEAKAALIWLRGGSEVGARHELEAMKQPNPGEAFISTESITAPSLVQTFRTRGARRALAISISIFVLQMFSGINTVTFYAGIIFKEAGSPLSPEDSSIVTASIILFGSLINLVIVDKLGRKPLLYASFGVGSISLAVLSIFLYVQMIGVDVTNYGWVSVASIGIYVFSFAIGLSAVPGVIMNEVCSPIIKPTVLALNAISSVICVTAVLQSFPYLEKYLGLYSTFAIPAVINVIGVIFTWLVVPETKGKSLAQIDIELNS